MYKVEIFENGWGTGEYLKENGKTWMVSSPARAQEEADRLNAENSRVDYFAVDAVYGNKV